MRELKLYAEVPKVSPWTRTLVMCTMIANCKERAKSDVARWFQLEIEEMRELKLYEEVP